MKVTLAPFLALFTLAAAAKSPVAVEWRGAGETLPAAVARPFAGFLPDGSFLIAGGSNFENGKKVYLADINVRAQDGTWKKIGALPRGVAEGVTCETPTGIFCGGGTDGKAKFVEAFLLTVENGTSRVSSLPSLPEPVAMGAAACEGSTVYVVGPKKVWALDLGGTSWQQVAEVPGPSREQPVAALQNGDQKEKLLVVFGVSMSRRSNRCAMVMGWCCRR